LVLAAAGGTPPLAGGGTPPPGTGTLPPMPEPGPLVFFSWGGPVMGGSLMLIDRRFTLGAPGVVWCVKWVVGGGDTTI
jgi:hypothetical protein